MAFDIHRNKNPRMKLIYLSGSLREIGEDYGAYLKRWYRSTPLYLFSRIVDLFIEHSTQDRPQTVKRAMREFVYRYIEKNAMNSLTPEFEELLDGMAKGLGISRKEIRKAVSFADVFPHLVNIGGMINRSLFPHSLVGCSSFFGWGNFTKYGNLLHARNFDFFGGREWEDNHAIIIMKPRGMNSNLTVTSDSALIPGVTTLLVNGTVMDLHLNYTREVSRKGINILALMATVALKAKNLEEVEEYISKYQRFTGWGLLVSNPAYGGALFEMTAKRYSKRILKKNSYIFYNNDYFNPEFKKKEAVPAYRWVLFNTGRDRRMEELLKENFGEIDPSISARILSDHYDVWENKERGPGHIISCVYNASSVIFDVENDTLYMAVGGSPVNNNPFYPVKISDLWYGKLTIKGDPLQPSIFARSKKIEGLRHYISAYYAWWYKLDICRAIEELDRAVEIDPEEPQYYLLRSWMKLKAGYNEDALSDIEKYLEFDLHPYNREMGELWRSRILDLAGRVEEGRKIVKHLSNSKFPDIKKWAAKTLNKPYSISMVKRLDIDFVLGEFFDY